MSSKIFWDSYYSSMPIGSILWDISAPDKNLVEHLTKMDVIPINALDVGCGTGNDAIYMAEQGINVTAIDVAAVPIEYAKAQIAEKNLPIEFLIGDIIDYNTNLSYDFIFDRGCFHGIKQARWPAYIKKINNILSNTGSWMVIIAQKPNEEIDINGLLILIEKELKIIKVLSTTLDLQHSQQIPASVIVAQKN